MSLPSKRDRKFQLFKKEKENTLLTFLSPPCTREDKDYLNSAASSTRKKGRMSHLHRVCYGKVLRNCRVHLPFSQCRHWDASGCSKTDEISKPEKKRNFTGRPSRKMA